MIDDADIPNPAPSAPPGKIDDDLRKLVLVVAGCVVAIALVESIRWCGRRIERRMASRHPVLTELVEELVDPPWHLQ